MATNTLLTVDMITNEALRVLHQKLNFIGTVDRQYDSQFAKSGAKIGSTLRIRKPAQYTVRTGATIDVQNSVEDYTSLTVSTQKGVDMSFTSAELAMSVDDFSNRFLKPAMSRLAAEVESNFMSYAYKKVYQQSGTGTFTAALDFDTVLGARTKMTNALAPADGRVANLNTRANAEFVSAGKALFHDATTIAEQYREGMVGRTAGFDFYENTFWPRHTSGSDASAYMTNSATAQTGSTIIVNTGTGTFKAGDIVTIGGVYRVHPETKVTTGDLMQFVITADIGANATSITISPAIVASGATQNVSNGAANTQAVTKVGGASKAYDISLAYHKEFATFATADLLLPGGVDFASRKVLDGISMRVVRQYDINNDTLPCRFDLLYGYEVIRPEFACRIASHGDS